MNFKSVSVISYWTQCTSKLDKVMIPAPKQMVFRKFPQIFSPKKSLEPCRTCNKSLHTYEKEDVHSEFFLALAHKQLFATSCLVMCYQRYIWCCKIVFKVELSPTWGSLQNSPCPFLPRYWASKLPVLIQSSTSVFTIRPSSIFYFSGCCSSCCRCTCSKFMPFPLQPLCMCVAF